MVSDPRGFAENIALRWDGREIAFEPGTNLSGAPGAMARLGDPREAEGGFAFTLELKGGRELKLAPMGRVTNAALSSLWPHPSFDGAF